LSGAASAREGLSSACRALRRPAETHENLNVELDPPATGGGEEGRRGEAIGGKRRCVEVRGGEGRGGERR
jgi:hypothetical protein